MSRRNILIGSLDRQPGDEREVEIVERKGRGHPDSICDGVAESVSVALAEAYRSRFGKVLHYNTDEAQLIAGETTPRFGGGNVKRPINIVVVGRATKEYRGKQIPVEDIARAAAKEYLIETLPHLDVDNHVKVDVRLGEGSGDLQAIYDDKGTPVPMSNDTSFGVGYAPLTETEKMVKAIENGLYEQVEPTSPIGPDIKVMAKRERDEIDLTVAVALVDKHVSDIDHYKEEMQRIEDWVLSIAEEITDRTVNVSVNTADDYETNSVYLTVTGTSAEQGDDGSVGRGNRTNGLITPDRPMSMEAASGKNPVSHVGKVYNILASEIAETVAEDVGQVEEAHVRLVSQIGEPIDRPQIANCQITTVEGVSVEDIDTEVAAIIDEELDAIGEFTERLISGEVRTF